LACACRVAGPEGPEDERADDARRALRRGRGMTEDEKANKADDTPEEAAIRARWEAEIREEHGQEWLDRHAGLLDAQWEYVKLLGL
jgi:hypothetical protein